jgi:hypothetical protein
VDERRLRFIGTPPIRRVILSPASRVFQGVFLKL